MLNRSLQGTLKGTRKVNGTRKGSRKDAFKEGTLKQSPSGFRVQGGWGPFKGTLKALREPLKGSLKEAPRGGGLKQWWC